MPHNPSMHREARARRKPVKYRRNVPVPNSTQLLPPHPAPAASASARPQTGGATTENPSTKADQQACPHGACSSDPVKSSVMLNGGVCAANADPYRAKQRPFWTRALFTGGIKMFLREVKSARVRRFNRAGADVSWNYLHLNLPPPNFALAPTAAADSPSCPTGWARRLH
jgi:hypothetical protein